MIHNLADVQTINIGEETSIWQFTVVLEGAKIGRNCNINCHCFVENDVTIGDNVTIKSGVYLWDGISIENNVFIGPSVSFVNNKYVRSKQYPKKHIGCTIGFGASIGSNATILSEITIGKFAFIGAGAVVTKDVEPYAVVLGNPAKVIGYMTAEGIKLDLDLVDKNTGNEYFFNSSNELQQKS